MDQMEANRLNELLDRLKHDARREIRYTRGMQCMYRERYLVYLQDLRKAREAQNFHGSLEIMKDMIDYTQEVRNMMVRQHAAYQRLWFIQRDSSHMDTQSVASITAPVAALDIEADRDAQTNLSTLPVG